MQLYLIAVSLFQPTCKKCLDKFSYYKCLPGFRFRGMSLPIISWKWSNIENLSPAIMYRSIPKPAMPPPPGQTPGHLTFLNNFGQIPCYVASLDGQMPHPLKLQRGSNPPLSRHVKQTVETSSAKFSATTNFLFSLSSLHTLNKGIFHDRTR